MAERFNDNDLDRVIDDVAREVTAGEPDGAFRAHVLERIDSGESVRSRWRAAWAFAPLATGALIVIAIAWLVRDGRSPERLALQRSGQTTATQPSRERRTETPEPRNANRAPSPDSRGPSPEPQAPSPEPRAPRPEPRAPNPTASAVAALAPPPLSVETIALVPIEPGESLQVPQIEQPPSLAVAPLDAGNVEKEIRR